MTAYLPRPHRPFLVALIGVTTVCMAHSVFADIVAVDPFEGDASETFESATLGFHEALDIFLLDPNLIGEHAGQMVPAFITSASSFMGSTITARTGGLFAHMTGPVEFVFNEPVEQFGGYVATNSGESGGLVEFFDADDALLGTASLDVTFATGSAAYAWNGWRSDAAFSRVRITSNGVLGGFLGFDDLEVMAVAVPAPGCIVLLAFGLATGRRRRRGHGPHASTLSSN